VSIPSSALGGGPVLLDPWSRRGRLPLDGPLERASVSRATLSFVTGLLGLAGAFLLFQFVVTPVLLVAQIALREGGLSVAQLPSPDRLMTAYTRELVLSNGIGQVVGLAVPGLLAARLHSSDWAAYLRLRSVDGRLLLLALVGVVGLQPMTQWLAQVNQQLPLPESLRMIEQSQLDLIRQVLDGQMGLGFNLVLLALVPGICEEVLFRGYAQRQFERAGGPAVGVLLSGMLFGLYHLRPSQVLPLVVLGLFMAYLVWRTGSVVPAMAVHIAHNALAVLAARYVQGHPQYDLEALAQPSVPGYAVLGGLVIVGGVLYLLHVRAARLRAS